jgi:prepilin-type processing-associated H-X9-DG protein
MTLVELLVAVAIVAMLIAILAPTYNGIVHHGYQVMCGSNLHQIGTGFGAYLHEERTVQFPDAMCWPAIPGKQLDEWELFRCPEEPELEEACSALEYRSAMGYYVAWSEGPLCEVRVGPRPTWGWWPCPTTPYGATDYGFEDAGMGGDRDCEDTVVRIYDDETTEAKVIFGTAGFRNSFYSFGRELIKLPSLWGPLKPPICFPIPEGRTNYGYNVKMADVDGEGTLVAVDYPMAVANRPGEDVGARLNQALRHFNKANTLYIDGSVQCKPFSQLDPAIEANRKQWGN